MLRSFCWVHINELCTPAGAASTSGAGAALDEQTVGAAFLHPVSWKKDKSWRKENI